MSQISHNYAHVLYELHVSKEAITFTTEVLSLNPILLDVLKNPTIPCTQKYNVIDRIFPKELQNFLKVLCFHHSAALLPEILDDYISYSHEQEGILDAVLTYTIKPDPTTTNRIKEALKTKYQKQDVNLTMQEDPALLGGFLINADGQELDYSMRGRLKQLQQKLTWR
ncbi:ATP synthase subunit delta [Clostridiales bacterium CHKCI001]|nr:ATP synthase subunit delta [Clostridiales bacterium CHKCI001]